VVGVPVALPRGREQAIGQDFSPRLLIPQQFIIITSKFVH
jgi:hypothetical protein